MARRSLLAMAAAVLLSGCWSVGRDFAATPVKNIQQNVTTQREVFSYFGEPYKKGIENGFETWHYYYHYWELGQLRDSRELTVTFNKDGTVRSYTYSSNR
jgi:outer membrane protein assembly factor BamE (lipoprotein component of BamABCDE complex)